MHKGYEDDGHRIKLNDNVVSHAQRVFDEGLQLEAILILHEYMEQLLNKLYQSKSSERDQTHHLQFKNIIDIFRSTGKLAAHEYEVLNEFNRLRNICSNRVLDSSFTLQGAKRGDLIKAIELGKESEQIISKMSGQVKPVKRSRR